MKCNKCKTDNRPEAKYCKHCGQKLSMGVADPFANLIGLTKVKKEFNEFLTNVRCLRQSGDTMTLQCDTIIIGASGTGKTELAKTITTALYGAGVVKSPAPTIIDAVDWEAFLGDWEKNIRKVKDGVLVVDNVQKLVPDDYSKNVELLDKLISCMDQWDGNPVVILLGLPWGFREYLDKNSDVRRRFEFAFTLDEYTAVELTAITIQQLTKEYGAMLETDAYGKLERVFQSLVRHKPDGWSNAHVAIDKAREIYVNMKRRGGNTVVADDITGKEHHDKTAQEIMSELDDFVGIDNIKAELRSLIAMVDKQRRDGKKPTIESHFVFVGNPGTGKTTIARKFADIFRAMGVLPTGHLVEVARQDLVVGWIGQTAPKTNAIIDKAMGGVLFIDEAYTLAQGGDSDFGSEAIATLLKRLSDDKGKFICIVAGYPKEMFDFLQMNPGLSRRFNKEIKFKDYDGEALTEIFRRSLKRSGYTLDAQANSNIRNFFDMLKASAGDSFGNAGTVENILSEAIQRQNERLRKLEEKGVDTTDFDKVLTRDDIEGEENTRELNLNDVLAEMDRDFIGMKNIKQLIREIGKNIQLMKREIAAGSEARPFNMHLLITGNPGTGKTEVARRLGKVLKSLHVLASDEVIEVTRRDLVADHQGGTAETTMKVIQRAQGRVLFIDEAYTLATDDVGHEAIDTLMKAMSDLKGKFVVVLAGYRKEMDDFINANPGVSRRITDRLHIEDYSRDELQQIFYKMASKSKLTFTPEAKAKVEIAVDEIYSSKGKNFGNAGEMERLLKDTQTRRRSRLFELDDVPDDQLFVVQASDIPVQQRPDVKADDLLKELDELVGLDGVKNEIRNLANTLRIEKMMAEMEGKKFRAPDNHYLFLGNPGTGKTTVARIMGKIFLQLGITKNSKFIETDRSGLVDKYIGHTAPKTNDVVDSAMGGILFIDEAYTLVQGGPNDFGPEAIGTLLKRLEDDRGKFVCIAAGYTREMQEFLESNSGLTSRFNQTIYFDDYSAEQLAEIFKIKIKAPDVNLTLTPEAEARMLKYFQDIYANRDEHFGNARVVGNVLKKIKYKRSQRLMDMINSGNFPTTEQMHEIMPQDFDIEI